MTTIESSKKDERSRVMIEKDLTKQTVALPPKKVMASKLAAAKAAAAAAKATANTTTTTTTTTTKTFTTTTTTPTVSEAKERSITATAQANNNNGSLDDTSSHTMQSYRETEVNKRRLSSSIDNNREKRSMKEKPSANVKPLKSITHSDRVVQAEIAQYRPYFTESPELLNAPSHSDLRVVLEYPGPIEAENFLLLKPVMKNTAGKTYDEEEEDKDEYNPITDLMRTAELIYECYLEPEQQEKYLGNQSHGIMRNLTKYRNRRHATGFVQAVKDFNKVMRQLKTDGILSQNAKAMCHPNYDLACHILFQVYSRTVARQAEALNNYQAFSNNVYGEINPILVKEFIAKTGLNSRSVFMDMGCGIGNVVLQVAAQTGCEAYGIEIMETPCKFAKRQLKEYAARMKAWRLPTGKIHFRHGDFLDVAANDLYSTLKRSDVLLVNNYAFDAATNQALAQLFLDLKEGTKIISLKSFVPKHHKINQRTLNMPESILRVESFEYYSEAVSWTNNGGQYYIATVDRSRLAPYFEEMYGR